ncbi:MAG: ribonuclease R [Phycisphaerales bacterium]|nr:MAG: ribonuclease R [Phycisphaerales bacterium]
MSHSTEAVLKYRDAILRHVGHDQYTPASVEALAEDLRADDAEQFRAAVDELVARGELALSQGGKVMLPSLGQAEGEIEGIFQRTPRGFGFIRPLVRVREGQIYVPAEETNGALTGDRVRARVRRDRKREASGRGGFGPQYVASIVEVLERKRTSYPATMQRRGSTWLAMPDGDTTIGPVVIADAESKYVREGDKVVIEITEFPQGSALAEGVITRVLGEAGKPDVETQAIIAAYDLPENEFPEPCVEQAREATRSFDRAIERFLQEGAGALPDRLDLTDSFITTIDPPDAKDYDDAISVRRTDDGWELGVHIADVGHFIPPGSPLDEEARARGNSVYLPRHVIPMLPEILSNGICSLQEGVPRFAKSVFIHYDLSGRVVRTGMAQTIIRSAKRMTYLEAQALIDGNEEEARRHARTEPKYSSRLVNAVRQMDQLARVIRERRRAAGMIHLDLPDVELIFDENGHVVDAQPEDDAFTHTIIEMFMVEANEAVARLFDRLGVPVMRRVHPAPTPAGMEEAQKVAKVAGYSIPKNPTREQLQSILDATAGKPSGRAVHMAVLRTLSKAEYSPAPIGHFALASEAYLHFTSPIRRYADLLTHRLLQDYLALTDNGQKPPRGEKEMKLLGRRLSDSPAYIPREELVVIGRHLSDREANAADAERELRSFLVLQLLANKVGEVFDGVVTGVTPRGLFVQIDKYLADGYIKVEDLPGDVTRANQRPRWVTVAETGALVDKNSGRSFNFGDRLRVQIASVDLPKRRLELLVADAESRAAGKSQLKAVQGLSLGAGGGGLESAAGAGFKKMPGSTRRSRKSKARDRAKKDHRRDR